MVITLSTRRLQTSRHSGFTLIELLVVMVVVAVLASIVAPKYMDRVDTARETVLRQNLAGLRQSIDQFYRDKSRYPDSLAELVQQKYIRSIPLDPITERADSWVLIAPQEGGKGVFDVRSGSQLQAKDGSNYASW
jgi:general secretion pathway protein G